MVFLPQNSCFPYFPKSFIISMLRERLRFGSITYILVYWSVMLYFPQHLEIFVTFCTQIDFFWQVQFLQRSQLVRPMHGWKVEEYLKANRIREEWSDYDYEMLKVSIQQVWMLAWIGWPVHGCPWRGESQVFFGSPPFVVVLLKPHKVFMKLTSQPTRNLRPTLLKKSCS